MRMRRALDFVSCPDTPVVLTSMALVKEGLRWLTSSFLRCGRAAKDPRHPRLLDYASAPFSRVAAVLQYFAVLLTGQGSRWELVLGVSQCRTLDDWLRKHPAHAKNVTRAIFAAASWTHRRHEFLLKWPWKAAAIADCRLSDARRRAVAQDLWDTPPCCLDALFSRRLRSQVACPQDLQTPFWVSFLLGWSSQVSLTIAPVEFCHKQNRDRAHAQMSWAHFSALHVHAECKARQEAAARAALLLADQPAANAKSSAAPPTDAAYQRTALRLRTGGSLKFNP